MLSPRVKIIDMGMRQFVQNMKDMNGRSVSVGVQAPASNIQTAPGVTILQEAVWNEFGTSTNTPARPFLRTATVTGAPLVRSLLQGAVRGLARGTATPTSVMIRVGSLFRQHVQETIRTSSSWAKPNAPYTIRRKGSSIPLIHRRRLIRAISWRLR